MHDETRKLMQASCTLQQLARLIINSRFSAASAASQSLQALTDPSSMLPLLYMLQFQVKKSGAVVVDFTPADGSTHSQLQLSLTVAPYELVYSSVCLQQVASSIQRLTNGLPTVVLRMVYL
jgi:hypothetical protein